MLSLLLLLVSGNKKTGNDAGEKQREREREREKQIERERENNNNTWKITSSATYDPKDVPTGVNIVQPMLCPTVPRVDVSLPVNHHDLKLVPIERSRSGHSNSNSSKAIG